MVRELFEMARTKKACLIFFDEIDAVGGARWVFEHGHDLTYDVPYILGNVVDPDPDPHLFRSFGSGSMNSKNYPQKCEEFRVLNAGFSLLRASHVEASPIVRMLPIHGGLGIKCCNF